jgi:hypothetical protein
MILLCSHLSLLPGGSQCEFGTIQVLSWLSDALHCDRTFKITLNLNNLKPLGHASDSQVERGSQNLNDNPWFKKDFAPFWTLPNNSGEVLKQDPWIGLNGSKRGLFKSPLWGTWNENFGVPIEPQFPFKLGTFGNFWKPNLFLFQIKWVADWVSNLLPKLAQSSQSSQWSPKVPADVKTADDI